jgi:hypothetical protein
MAIVDAGGSSSLLTATGQDGSLIEENRGGTVTDYLYADGKPLSLLQSGASHRIRTG